MRYWILPALCCAFAWPLLCQSGFIPAGAVWRLEFKECSDGFPCRVVTHDIEKIEYDGDELVAGKWCKRLKVTKGTQPYYYLYEEGGKVYYYSNVTYAFHLLYDFNLSAGDFFLYTNFLGAPPDTVWITEVYPDTIMGQPLTVWKGRMGCWGSYHPILYNNRFGAMNEHPVYAHDFCTIDRLRSYLAFRCYRDDEMPTYNPVGLPCDSLVGVFTPTQNLSARCWPNPSSDILYIAHSEDEELNLCLYDVSGCAWVERRILRGVHNIEVPVGALPSGLYIAALRSADGRFYARRVRIHRR